MIILKNLITPLSNCGLLISNKTGFKSLDNPYGFLTPDVDIPSGSRDYFINDVYLFTIIVKNDYNGITKTNMVFPGNTGRIVTYVPDTSFDDLMNEAEINQSVYLAEDGYYSIFQLGIPKESIKSTERATAPVVYYVKPDLKVYTMVGIVETEVNLYDLIISNPTWINTNIVMVQTDIISQCYLEGCFNYVLEQFALEYSKASCNKNDITMEGLRESRDLLFAIITTVQYYIELGLYYDAAKLIYDASFCSLCQNYILNTATLNCNCNG